MSIYQKGGAWYIRVQVAGRRIERSVGKGATRKQALELEARIKDELHRTAHDGRMGRRPKRLFDDALIKWVEEYARFRRDYDKLKSHINTTIPFIEGVLLTDVVEAAEAMKRAMLAKGLKPATINRRLAVIRQVLNAAYRDWDWLDAPLGEKYGNCLSTTKGTCISQRTRWRRSLTHARIPLQQN